MSEIIRVKITGASGYCCAEEAYEDTLVIEKNSIKYEYKPLVETRLNPVRKWNYKTTSPLFEKKYRDVVSLMPSVMDIDDEEVFCTDVGGFDFTVTYSDGSKWENSFFTGGETFADLFRCINQMVPSTEYTPAMLLLFNTKVYVSPFEDGGSTKCKVFW